MLLPLRDENPSRSVAGVVYLLILLNCAAFIFETRLSPEGLKQLLFRYGFVSGQATAAFHGEASLLGEVLVPPITSMFLHGSFWHIFVNMLFLAVFGDNVEDMLGHGRFIAFYLLCGLAATALQYAVAPGASQPVIGASGAVAGVLGAYAVTWPGTRIQIVLFPFIFFAFALPAYYLLAYWFILQLVLAVAALGVPQTAQGGVAYAAHVGGFVLGVALAKVLPAGRTGKS